MRSGVALGVALAALAPWPAAGQEGLGIVGAWELVWRMSETDQDLNRFRAALGTGPEFPFRARVLSGLEGPRVVYFDADGGVEGEIGLAKGERALVAGDGSAHLVWSPDPLRRRYFDYRFFAGGNPEPVWEAASPGEPVLFAPDGTLFVIAAPDTAVDRFQRSWLQPGGRVQVVDASGDVRGEMPILPVYVRLTGDGRRIAMLAPRELVVLRRDGVLDWSEELPIDAVVAREGHSQLEAAGGRIVVCGTGALPAGQSARGLHAERRGTLRAFTDGGALLWEIEQAEDEPLWFQISLALSKDGGTLATFHSDERQTAVRLHDAVKGDRVWERTTPRRAGTSCLSVSDDGQLVALACGDARTWVVAWNREGETVWEGEIPLASRVTRLGAHGLLVSDRWIARLEPGP